MPAINPNDRIHGIRRIAYFQALNRFLTDHLEKDYTALLSLLFNREYTWSIQMDETRAAYVKIARDEYLSTLNLGTDEKIHWSESLDVPPTVLEVLVMLAKQMEDAFGYAREKDIPNWFWMMLKNLHISKYDDSILGTKEANIINDKLDIWLYREFEPNGHGSPFPLHRMCQDQRQVDLWQQANLYVTENFHSLVKEWTTDES